MKKYDYIQGANGLSMKKLYRTNFRLNIGRHGTAFWLKICIGKELQDKTPKLQDLQDISKKIQDKFLLHPNHPGLTEIPVPDGSLDVMSHLKDSQTKVGCRMGPTFSRACVQVGHCSFMLKLPVHWCSSMAKERTKGMLSSTCACTPLDMQIPARLALCYLYLCKSCHLSGGTHLALAG